MKAEVLSERLLALLDVLYERAPGVWADALSVVHVTGIFLAVFAAVMGLITVVAMVFVVREAVVWREWALLGIGGLFLALGGAVAFAAGLAAYQHFAYPELMAIQAIVG